MLAGGRIGPLASGALACTRPAQPNEHGSARRIVNVSDNPVAADAATVGKIVAADKFRLVGKPAGEIGCLD